VTIRGIPNSAPHFGQLMGLRPFKIVTDAQNTLSNEYGWYFITAFNVAFHNIATPYCVRCIISDWAIGFYTCARYHTI
jgi:hypothetical protein